MDDGQVNARGGEGNEDYIITLPEITPNQK